MQSQLKKTKEILFPKTQQVDPKPQVKQPVKEAAVNNNNVFIPPAAVEPVNPAEVQAENTDNNYYRSDSFAAEVEANLTVNNVASANAVNYDTQTQFNQAPTSYPKSEPYQQANVATVAQPNLAETAPAVPQETIANTNLENNNLAQDQSYPSRTSAMEADKLAGKKSLGNLFNFLKKV